MICTTFMPHFQPSNRAASALLVVALSVPTIGEAQGQTAGSTTQAAVAEALVPKNVLTLGAAASIEVVQDVLTVVYSVSRDGPDPQVVQSALKQALDAALGEARKVAKPGDVDVNTGGFSLMPRYSSKGVISGWTGTAELVTKGKDTQTLARLTARVQTMTVQRVGYELSREARERIEGDATAQAIGRFRAKAQDMARQFGFASYAIREVNVATNDPQPTPPAVMMRSRVQMAEASEALPTEAGKATVTAMVNGSVVMQK